MCLLHLVLISVNIYTKEISFLFSFFLFCLFVFLFLFFFVIRFCFEFELMAQPCSFVLYHGRAQKELARDVFDAFAIYVVFVTSVTQTAGHKNGSTHGRFFATFNSNVEF